MISDHDYLTDPANLDPNGMVLFPGYQVTAGREVWGYATGDTHKPRHEGNAWTVVQATQPIFRSKVYSIRVFRGIACRKLLCVGTWFSF